MVLCSCSTNGLDRNKATALLLKDQNIIQLQSLVPLSESGFAKGVEQKMWYDNSSISNGSFLISEVSNTNRQMHLLKPVDIKIDITGIAKTEGDDNKKEVQFTVTYHNIDGTIKRFATIGYRCLALLRLYDDGWRVENLSYEPLNEAFQLTAEEQNEERKYIEKILVEERQKEELDRIAREQLEIKRNKSLTPTKTLANYKLAYLDGSLYALDDISVTDVNVKIIKRIYGNASMSPQSLASTTSITIPDSNIEKNSINAVYERIRRIWGVQYRAAGNVFLCYSSQKNEIDSIVNVIREAHNKWTEEYNEFSNYK